ncbi:MAG TPA: PolC-type DNA polymerase III [Clostridiales bacterium]|nr:PolC-type DNA polymerase III [Clostridiales bacterium]
MLSKRSTLYELLKGLKVEYAKEYKNILSLVYIEKMIINKTKRSWKICLSSGRVINQSLLKTIEQKLKHSFPFFNKVTLTIIYNIPGSLEEFMDGYLENLKENICRVYPSLAGWLNGTVWKDNCIEFEIADEYGRNFIMENGICGQVKKMVKEQLNLEVDVNIYVNKEYGDTLRKDIYYKRLKEDKKMVESAANGGSNANPKPGGDRPHSSKGLSGDNTIVFGRAINSDEIAISEIREECREAVVKGRIINKEIKPLNGNKELIVFDITDYTNSITVKLFLDRGRTKDFKAPQNGQWIKVRGECQYDKYQRELMIIARDVNCCEVKERTDTSPYKRVELHAHTSLSAMDGVTPPSRLVERAAKWGHKAIAITDHGVVQAYPEIFSAGKKYNIKVIYGVEGYIVDDYVPIVINYNDEGNNDCFVAFDLETTGLSASSDKIIEIGAVKIIKGEIVDTFHSMVDPGIAIPEKIVKLTGINQDMVKGSPSIDVVLGRFKDFVGDSVLVAHNARFDISFIKKNGREHGIEFNNTVLDTLALARELYANLKRHRLKDVAKHLGFDMENAHRAVDDARVCGNILIRAMDDERLRNIKDLKELNRGLNKQASISAAETYHATILVKDGRGLTNLYKLISLSHLEYFYRRPRIPKTLLNKYREGLIIGSGCEAGELYQAILKGYDEKRIIDIANYYDFLEVQPLANNEFLVRSGVVANNQQLIEINKRIIDMGERLNKPVVATGDVHFLDPEDEYYRRILMKGQGFADADRQAPLFLKTTQEMLEDFYYLSRQQAEEIVIHNTNTIADMIEHIRPIPNEFCPPQIEGAEQRVRDMTKEKAMELYGQVLPEIVRNRIEKELSSIIDNGYAVLYYIAHKLVKKSLDDGYLVGSRGSVGSSLVATLCGITEVNPLPPHYRCPTCKYSDFEIDTGRYDCGIDLPDKPCPKCGTRLAKDGFNIPFEVFLGFKGDKVPDIDLNFSGEYQSKAHKYAEELLGKGHVYRAGTIATIAQKTAYGFVKAYLDEKGIVASEAEMRRLINGCTGIKRTTGQHPGGVIVVPKDKQIFEFTPIQYPADDKSADVITTHFDYHSLENQLVKLDILGHDDPTVIKMLEDMTGIKAKDIPLDDEKVMSIFSGTSALGLAPEDINSPVGTFGIPEFGTRFVRTMLEDTKPTTFGELIRISGLSHGTDVWLNNAQQLIKNGTAKLSEVICTRDDIMTYLISKGMQPAIAFRIMENVRKGKGLTEEEQSMMQEKQVPQWFIESCKKIKYMFPKAHAAAYVIMAFRIAYFKVYYPAQFYAAYFTARADDFDADLMVKGEAEITKKMEMIQDLGNKATAKDKNMLTILEVGLEMYKRGIKLCKVDLYKSHPERFIVTDDGILPPLNSLQGVGKNAAWNIARARQKQQFLSIEDIKLRAKASKSVIEALSNHGCLEGMPASNQISLFSY